MRAYNLLAPCPLQIGSILHRFVPLVLLGVQTSLKKNCLHCLGCMCGDVPFRLSNCSYFGTYVQIQLEIVDTGERNFGRWQV